MSARKKNGKSRAVPKSKPKWTLDELRKFGPPYTLTPHEEADIRLHHGFTEDSIDYAGKVIHATLHDLEYELRALAEQVFNARPDSDVWSEDEAREYAVNAAAYARSLCDIANKMSRCSGRAEAYADCLAHLKKADGTVEAFKRGDLGGPPFTRSERRAEYQASVAAHKADRDGAS